MKEGGKPCVNPPEFVISVLVDDDEYMVGVTCNKHRQMVSKKLKELQEEEKIPKGKINFSELRAVGTDCIKADADDLIRL